MYFNHKVGDVSAQWRNVGRNDSVVRTVLCKSLCQGSNQTKVTIFMSCFSRESPNDYMFHVRPVSRQNTD
jgi:hypothetical protein